ncbi:MAG: cytochrome c3 family protein [Nitrospirae bacterium]|nr:cytochrome c3 family protein [Nitrospirota bacterium]
MRTKCIAVIFILIMIASAYVLSVQRPHEFSPRDCVLCHFDEKNEPMNIKPHITGACETCHSNLKQTQSHPTDLIPSMPIPSDMPLMRGRLTCITCHYVHPASKKITMKKNFLLRKQISGPQFCVLCHDIDQQGHFVSSYTHEGGYKVTDRTTRIDKTSLQCIECHDSQLDIPGGGLGAGTWNHSRGANHPIGVSYSSVSMKNPRNYRPSGALRKEIVLFNGNIGCGTCHNIYAKGKFMLVMDNNRSALCLECHIK